MLGKAKELDMRHIQVTTAVCTLMLATVSDVLADWKSLDGKITDAPVVVSWAKNRLDVFARGSDNAVWHIWCDGNQWGQWESLGGKIRGTPTAVSWGPGRLDIFARGND